MIYGVGCDVVEVARVAEVMAERGDRFARRILSEPEWATYEKRRALSPARGLAYVASRWAAKEAISKALGTGISGDVTFHSMIIGHRDSGAPTVCFAEPLAERLSRESITVHVSITDEKNVVAAFAVAEVRDNDRSYLP